MNKLHRLHAKLDGIIEFGFKSSMHDYLETIAGDKVRMAASKVAGADKAYNQAMRNYRRVENFKTPNLEKKQRVFNKYTDRLRGATTDKFNADSVHTEAKIQRNNAIVDAAVKATTAGSIAGAGVGAYLLDKNQREKAKKHQFAAKKKEHDPVEAWLLANGHHHNGKVQIRHNWSSYEGTTASKIYSPIVKEGLVLLKDEHSKHGRIGAPDGSILKDFDAE